MRFAKQAWGSELNFEHNISPFSSFVTKSTRCDLQSKPEEVNEILITTYLRQRFQCSHDCMAFTKNAKTMPVKIAVW